MTLAVAAVLLVAWAAGVALLERERRRAIDVQRGEHLARRKEIYEALHPEASYEARPGRAGKGNDPESGSTPAPAFVDDAAARTGRSRSAVAEDVQIDAIDVDPRVLRGSRGICGGFAISRAIPAATGASPRGISKVRLTWGPIVIADTVPRLACTAQPRASAATSPAIDADRSDPTGAPTTAAERRQRAATTEAIP